MTEPQDMPQQRFPDRRDSEDWEDVIHGNGIRLFPSSFRRMTLWERIVRWWKS